MLPTNQRDVLRELADETMRLAALPVQRERIALWKALNRGEMARPMVVMDQLPWNELGCDELTLRVTDPYWRGVEEQLRRQLYQYRRFPVDMVIDPFISIPKVLRRTGFGLLPEVERIGKKDAINAQHFTNLLTCMDDVQKITDDHITHDTSETDRRMQEAEALFGDIAPARAKGETFFLGVWDYLSQIMGVQDAYLAMFDDPDLLHAALDRATCATIAAIEDANACGAHNDIGNTCHCSYIYCDDLLPDSGQGKGPRSENCWSFGLAQLFSSVSPALFEEYELPYVTRMAPYFGALYYGCCDRLDDRLDVVKRIPRVRKVSCSPWSDRKNFAERIGTELIMSVKPSPAFLATASFDEDAVREDIRLTCRLARENNVNLEFILKDVSTVQNEAERLTRWANAVMEVVQGA